MDKGMIKRSARCRARLRREVKTEEGEMEAISRDVTLYSCALCVQQGAAAAGSRTEEARPEDAEPEACRIWEVGRGVLT